jgi:hypothetical protein
MCRTLSAITLACLLFGCAKKEEPTNPNPPVNPTPNPQPGPTRPSAKDPEPKTTPTPANSGPDLSKVDFTLSAEALGKEIWTNPKEAEAKYSGKVLEVTGKVESCDIDKRTRMIRFVGDASGGLRQWCPAHLQESEWEKEQGLRALSLGQTVTVRGKGPGLRNNVFDNCIIVKVGPSTAKPMTAGELAKGLQDSERKKELENIEVVIRGKVVDNKQNVTDPDTPDGPKINLWDPTRGLLKDEVMKLKQGDVVYVIGKPRAGGGEILLENPRVLKEPPSTAKKGEEKPTKWIVRVISTKDGAIEQMALREDGAPAASGKNFGADVPNLQKELKTLFDKEQTRINAAKGEGRKIPPPKLLFELDDKLLQAHVVQLLDAGVLAGFTDIAPVPIGK